MCRGFGGMAPSSNGPVAVGNACDILANWDLHENLSSRGAILFRRFWSRALAAATPPWTTQFDASDPVNTPNGLNTSAPTVQQALGDAISDLNGGGIALDAAPRDVQFTTRNGKKIPITGGPGDPNGNFNAISAPWNGKGFDDIQHGSSYVQVVTWNNGPCPDARTILTYSESTDSTRSDFGDQTKLFSGKKWVKDLFCKKDVVRGTLSTTTVAKGKKTKVRGRTRSTRPSRAP
jgi:acyl-homoserine-lactone acylase